MTSRVATIDLAPGADALLQSTFYETFDVRLSPRLIERITAIRPDLIVQDLRDAAEPTADATFAPAVALKSNAETAQIPLVLLVGDGNPALRLQALAAGADEVLSHRRELALLPARAASLIRSYSALTELCLHAGTAMALGLSADLLDNTGQDAESGSIFVIAARDVTDSLRPSLDAAFGLEVRSAADGPRALAMLQDRAADALVIDGRDDPARAIRSAAALAGSMGRRRPPALLMVEADQLAVVRRGMEIGAIDAVATSDDPREIAGRLRVLVRGKVQADSLRRLAMQSDRMAVTDCLTGLHNRRYAMCHLERMVARATATGQDLALLTIDIDGLKRVNDRHGHAAGDTLLRAVAERLRRAVRGPDLLARIGGDEFVVAMPGVCRERARSAARRLRERIAAEPLDLPGRQTLTPAVSIGLATLRDGDSMEVLLERSDAALYESRRSVPRGGGCRPSILIEGTPANVAQAPREREPV